MTFRPERVTEGNIAVDDDLTTPVFSPYSGRVIKLIAKLGDHVERGAPLMAVEATEFVQAQNDLITAASTLKTARSQLSLAQAAEQRQHLLFLGKGAALKDWQQSQADLATAQDNVRAQQIALSAVRNRLRILGKSDAEIARIETGAAQNIEPVAYVVGADQRHRDPAPGRPRPEHPLGPVGRVDPGLHDRQPVDGVARRQRARGGRPADPGRRAARSAGAGVSGPGLQGAGFRGSRPRSTPIPTGCRCAPMSRTPMAP